MLTLCCSVLTACAAERSLIAPDSATTITAARQPKLTGTEAFRVANAAAMKGGYDLASFAAPEARYDRSDPGDHWWVHYTGKVRRPGNHFSVRVHDKTRETHLFRGR
jgi:hypothetical protein